MLQKSVDKQKRIGELNMIIATLSDFKLFWDLLDNTDTTEITTEQDSDFMLQLTWKLNVFLDPEDLLKWLCHVRSGQVRSRSKLKIVQKSSIKGQ